MFNKNHKIKKFNYPFPFIIIEDFLDTEFFKNLEDNFPSLEEFKLQKNNIKRMDFDTSQNDDLYEKYKLRSKSFNNFHKWVFSVDFSKFFLNLFKNDINNEFEKSFLTHDIKTFKLIDDNYENLSIINKKSINSNISEKILYPRIDVGTGIKNYGINTGGRGPHIDNPQRLISILYYCGGFSKIEGGEHRIYEINKNKKDLNIFKTIYPKKNTLIASIQNNIAFHDVNPVTNIEGQRNAFYLAISSNLRIWKNLKRNRVNLLYNKNRYDFNFLDKLLSIFFKKI